MFLFIFWWCVDDHLATVLDIPALGEIPFWVILVLSVAFGPSTFTCSKN